MSPSFLTQKGAASNLGRFTPRAWRLNGPTAAGYPVMEVADAQPLPFPGFDRLVLDRAQFQG
jgi:hypothetical protein